MADNPGVWGIDIGQAGLKAIRLRYAEAAKQLIAVAFDYIPHPKILSQPDAVPEELIQQALETFLSRNDLRDDLIAISVPGQTSLAKFIKLPPVESSKVSEIVRYEAKQQIPFDLDDVIWDFQTLGGGVEESGFMLEAEVGMFAMKREQVMGHLQPYTDARQDVELIQIAPLALYNFVSYDYLGLRVDEKGEFEDSGAETEHAIILDMGADNTTLLVTNGDNIWIRNVPIGGNHFTRALVKDMKLTFAKAEHLKCNATKSPDPKAVFQALRPVFNDYVSEIQRSIGYFSSVNRDARIRKVLGVGNGFKLAGMQKFLQQNLQYEVERVESLQSPVGDAVLNSSLFQENVMSFVVPYGLALQALKLTRIHTTLLPREIATARTIRRKKPVVVATAATLLASLALSGFGYARVAETVSDERWSSATAAVDELQAKVSSNTSAFSEATSEHGGILKSGNQLITVLPRRELWLEVYKAIDECLPRDQGNQLDEEDITKLHRMKLTSITSQKMRRTELAAWHARIDPSAIGLMDRNDRAAPPAPETFAYLFTLDGLHYRDDDKKLEMSGRLFVQNALLANLKKWEVDNSGSGKPTPVRRIGITHPVVISATNQKFTFDPNRNARRTMLSGRGFRGVGDERHVPDEVGAVRPNIAGEPGPGERKGSSKNQEIQQTRFRIQFVWTPILPQDRAERGAAPVAAAPNDTKRTDGVAGPDGTARRSGSG